MKPDDMMELLADFLEEDIGAIKSYHYSQQPPKFDTFSNEISNEFMPEPEYMVVWQNEYRMPKEVKLSELLGHMYRQNRNTRNEIRSDGLPD